MVTKSAGIVRLRSEEGEIALSTLGSIPSTLIRRFGESIVREDPVLMGIETILSVTALIASMIVRPASLYYANAIASDRTSVASVSSV